MEQTSNLKNQLNNNPTSRQNNNLSLPEEEAARLLGISVKELRELTLQGMHVSTKEDIARINANKGISIAERAKLADFQMERRTVKLLKRLKKAAIILGIIALIYIIIVLLLFLLFNFFPDSNF